LFNFDDLYGSKQKKAVVKKDPKRKLTKSEENEVVDRQKNKCAICGKPLKRSHTHFDHKTPHSKGGKTNPSNMQAVCMNCHGDKTNQDRIKDIKKKIADRKTTTKSKKSYANPFDLSLPIYKPPRMPKDGFGLF